MLTANHKDGPMTVRIWIAVAALAIASVALDALALWLAWSLLVVPCGAPALPVLRVAGLVFFARSVSWAKPATHAEQERAKHTWEKHAPRELARMAGQTFMRPAVISVVATVLYWVTP